MCFYILHKRNLQHIIVDYVSKNLIKIDIIKICTYNIRLLTGVLLV